MPTYVPKLFACPLPTQLPWFSTSPSCRPKGHPDDVNTVAWSPDGRCLASGSDDETIRVYVRDR